MIFHQLTEAAEILASRLLLSELIITNLCILITCHYKFIQILEFIL